MAIKNLIPKLDNSVYESGIQLRSDDPEVITENQLWVNGDNELKVTDAEIVMSDTRNELDSSSEQPVISFAEIFEENSFKYNATISGAANTVFSVVHQPDGKILVGGSFTTFGGNPRNYIVRLNADGSEDTLFYNLLVTGGALNGTVREILLQPDGKIVIAGEFTSLKGNTRNRIVRLNRDGSEDASFYTNLGTGIGGTVLTNCLKLQLDGKILVGGSFTTVNAITRNRIVRLNADGSVDTAFYTNLGAASTTDVTSIDSLPDGRILIGFSGTSFGGLVRNYLTCRNEDGTEDISFYNTIGKNIVGGPVSTAFNSTVTAITYHDNKILIGGTFTAVNGITRNRVVRLNLNGTLDTNFSTNIGAGANDVVRKFVVDSYGDIVITGNFTAFNSDSNNRMVSILNNDGTFNRTKQIMFGSGFSLQVWGCSLLGDKIVFSGEFTTLNGITKNRIAFFENVAGPQIRWTDGKLFNYQGKDYSESVDLDIISYSEDTAFYTNLGTGFNGQVRKVLKQTDGKLIVIGDFTQLNGITRNRVVRLNPNGTVDTTHYALMGTASNNIIRDAILQADGKLILVGDFNGASSFNAQTRNRIVRLNTDGSEDTAFYTSLGTGFNGIIYSVIQQLDEKIVLVGAFTQLNAITRNYIVRLNLDGTVDTAFYTNLGTALNNVSYRIVQQPDTKLVAVGIFTTLNAITRNRIVRLNLNGTVDTAFYTNLGTAFSGATDVDSLAVQSDGKILVGGNFVLFNGNTRNRIVRLNTDGSEDTAFYANIGLGFNGYTHGITVSSDGKILVGGNFTQLNGKECKYLVRLNSDGREDYKFNSSLRKDSIISSTMEFNVLVISTTQDQNDTFIVGNFTQFDNKTRNRMIKISEVLDENAESKDILVSIRANDEDIEAYFQSIIEG